MPYAVRQAVCGLLRLGVLTAYGVGLAVIVPDIGLPRTDRNGLHVFIHFLVDIRRDDTVATQGRLVLEYILAGLGYRLLAIRRGETQERHAFGQLVLRINAQVQDIE